jgi:GDP-L-fucose synthase
VKKILILGSSGMVGSAVYRLAKKKNCFEIIAPKTSKLNLLNQIDVQNFIKDVKPDCIIIAAARVGGIWANNTYPAEFIYQNSVIQTNVIHSAHLADVDQIIFLGSSCIYPTLSSQPIEEGALLSGMLEPTNEPYAVAKIQGIKMCEAYNKQYNRDYRSLMPTNLYGPMDNFHLENSHVIPSLIKKFHFAKVNKLKNVTVWGTGQARREFLYVDDLADAIFSILDIEKNIYLSKVNNSVSHLNIGTGKDMTIKELVKEISSIVGYIGNITYDTSKPDGMLRKCLNIKKVCELGWVPKTDFKMGLEKTYDWFILNQKLLKNT